VTSWTAVVPLKEIAARKTRLTLAADTRRSLTETMAEHVLAALRQAPEVGKILLLTKSPRAGYDWVRDEGRGLNEELQALRAALPDVPFLIVHADLPEIRPADIGLLVAATDGGKLGIAPDRHGTGTNALALPPGVLPRFAFGPGSCARHQTAWPMFAVVRTDGLARDVDTDADLASWNGERVRSDPSDPDS